MCPIIIVIAEEWSITIRVRATYTQNTTTTTCGNRAITTSNLRDYRGCNMTTVSRCRRNVRTVRQAQTPPQPQHGGADIENCLHDARRSGRDRTRSRCCRLERTHVDDGAVRTMMIISRPTPPACNSRRDGVTSARKYRPSNETTVRWSLRVRNRRPARVYDTSARAPIDFRCIMNDRCRGGRGSLLPPRVI